MNDHVSHSQWHRFAPSLISKFGWLSLLFGIFFGGLQTAHHVRMYYANSHRVTLDRVYAILFLWCFWVAVSIGYIVCARLAKHEIFAGAFAASILATGHVAVIALIFAELHWL